MPGTPLKPSHYRGMNDDTKALVRLAQDYGWAWEVTDGNHLFGKAPDGSTMTTLGMKTPAWNSAYKNARALLKAWITAHPIPVEPVGTATTSVGQAFVDAQIRREAEASVALDGDTIALDESSVSEDEEYLHPAGLLYHGVRSYEPEHVSDRFDEVRNRATDQIVDYQCKVCGDRRDTLLRISKHYGARHVRWGDKAPSAQHLVAVAHGTKPLSPKAGAGTVAALGASPVKPAMPAQGTPLPPVPPEVEILQRLAEVAQHMTAISQLVMDLSSQVDQAQAKVAAQEEWNAWLALIPGVAPGVVEP